MKFFALILTVFVIAAIIDTCSTSPIDESSNRFNTANPYSYGDFGFGSIIEPVTCGQVETSRIIGGVEAVPHEFPWQVAVVIDGSSFCGGSLISPDWVLTAAHCADGAGGVNRFQVILDNHYKKLVEPLKVRVVDSINHPNYNSKTRANDIALLRLESPISSTGNTPVCLPSASETVFGKTLIASDWSGLETLSQPVDATASLIAVDGNGVHTLMGVSNSSSALGTKIYTPVMDLVPWISNTIGGGGFF